MALQVTLGSGSLVALGFSIGDVAALASVGRKLGNWLTSNSDGKQLLELLDLDEVTIFQRRGLLDVTKFNRQWSATITLRVNDRVESFAGRQARNALGSLTLFSCVMVSLTAALEAFAYQAVALDTLKRVLSGVLAVAEFGEETLNAQIRTLHSGWRSEADVRGLTCVAKRVRLDLVRRHAVLDGLMPAGEGPAVVQFLSWLLKGSSDTFTTSSSDVAGVAFCLSQLGMDVLGVEGLVDNGDGNEDGNGAAAASPCRLVFDREAFLDRASRDGDTPTSVFARYASTAVSLDCPEESLASYPIKSEDARERCRRAWAEGSKAAQQIACSVIPAAPNGRWGVWYAFKNRGTEPAPGEISDMYAFCGDSFFGVNQELLDGLQRALPREYLFYEERHNCLHYYLPSLEDINVLNPQPDDERKIAARVAYQAFLMGYYYAIFLRFVDTSMLQLRTVEGSWGFRAEKLEYLMSTKLRCEHITDRTRVYAHHDVLYTLSLLLCGNAHILAQRDLLYGRDAKAEPSVGFLGRRALLARSLFRPCCTLSDAASFVLLDCDVSDVPRDKAGFVRPGTAQQDTLGSWMLRDDDDDDEQHLGGAFAGPVSEAEDVTFHLQPDWDHNEETVLLCVRYKGRLVARLNPYRADRHFSHMLVRPSPAQPNPDPNPDPNPNPNPDRPDNVEEETIEWTAADVLNRRRLPTRPRLPIVVRVGDRPRLWYAAAALFASQAAVVKVASYGTAAAVAAAVAAAKADAEKTETRLHGSGGSGGAIVVVVGGGGGPAWREAKLEDWCATPLPVAWPTVVRNPDKPVREEP